MYKRQAERGVTVRLTDSARDYVIENGYDPIYGARPLKRFIPVSYTHLDVYKRQRIASQARYRCARRCTV